MPSFKVKVQYTQFDKGFQEIYYRDAASLVQAADIPANVITRLISFRASGCFLRKIATSSVVNNRDAVIRQYDRQPPVLQTVDPPDVTNVAAVYTLASSDVGHTRHVWFRGLADANVMRDQVTGHDQPSDYLGRQMDLLRAALASNGFRIRGLKRVGVGGVTTQNLTSIDAVANAGSITVNWVGAFAVLASGRVIISQTNKKDFPALDGHWTPYDVQANSFKLRYNYHRTGNFPLLTGKVRQEEYEYGAIDVTLGGFLKFGSRDTGKNPLGGRGRRSATRIRSL